MYKTQNMTPQDTFEQAICHYKGKEGKEQNYEKAHALFLEAANAGHIEAQYYLGRMLRLGNGVEKDTNEALKLYTTSASQGCTKAQVELGYLYLFGKGVEPNYEEAKKLFLSAAEQNKPIAQFYLGIMYHFGKGVERDFAQAAKWYKLAADQKYAKAQCRLGLLYETGNGVDKDFFEAEKLYRLSAEQGESLAQYHLGQLYDTGKHGKQDTAEASKWYKLAAEQGNADAQFAIGKLFYFGNRVEENPKEALHWFRLAAEKNHCDAQFYLGNMYASGKGIITNIIEAEKWYNLAKENGSRRAIRALERIDRNRQKLESNAEALALCKSAAENGDPKEQYNLGYRYRFGRGVARDYFECKKWFRLSAEQGYCEAQFSLGNLYREGSIKHRIARNLEEAAKWYKEAAAQGHKGAQHNLGHMYSHGHGVSQDYAEAAKWYQLAAEQGVKESQYRLAYMYEAGYGIEKDLNTAMHWYQSSADNGYIPAINRIAQEMYNKEAYKEAYHWYQKPAQDGNATAQLILAEMHIAGQGCEKSIEQAIQLLLDASKNGSQQAMYELSRICIGEFGTGRNLNECIKYLSKCKDIRSQLKLAELYLHGIHVEKNTYKAVKIWKDIARQGYKCAHYNLALASYFGIGTNKDKTTALHHLNEVKEYDNNASQLLAILTNDEVNNYTPRFRSELKLEDITAGSILEAEWKYINIKSPHLNKEYNDDLKEIIEIYKAHPTKESYFWLARLYQELRFENHIDISEFYFEQAVKEGHAYAKYIKETYDSDVPFSEYDLYLPYYLHDILDSLHGYADWGVIYAVSRILKGYTNDDEPLQANDYLLSKVNGIATRQYGTSFRPASQKKLYKALTLRETESLREEFIEHLWNFVMDGKEGTLSFPGEIYYNKLADILADCSSICLDGTLQYNIIKYLDDKKQYIIEGNIIPDNSNSTNKSELETIIELIKEFSNIENFNGWDDLDYYTDDTLVIIPDLSRSRDNEKKLSSSEDVLIEAYEKLGNSDFRKGVMLVNQEFCSCTMNQLFKARVNLIKEHHLEKVIELVKGTFKDVDTNTYLLVLNYENEYDEVRFVTQNEEITVPYSLIEENQYILNHNIYQEPNCLSDEMTVVRLCDIIELQATDGNIAAQSNCLDHVRVISGGDFHGSLLGAISKRTQSNNMNGWYKGEYIFLKYDNGIKIHIQDQDASSTTGLDILPIKIKNDTFVTTDYLVYVLLSSDMQKYMESIVDDNGNFMIEDLLYKKVAIHKDPAAQKRIVEEALIRERQRFSSGIEYNVVVMSENPEMHDIFNGVDGITTFAKNLKFADIFDTYIKDGDKSIIDAIILDDQYDEFDDVMEEFNKLRERDIHIYIISESKTVKGKKKIEYFISGNRIFNIDREDQNKLIEKLRDDLDASNSYQAKIRMKHKDVFEAADGLDKKHGLNISKVIMRYIQNGYMIDYAENTPFDQLRTVCHTLLKLLATKYDAVPNMKKEGAIAGLLANRSYTDKADNNKQYVMLHPIMSEHLAKSLEYFCYIANNTIHGKQDSSKLGMAAINILMEFILWFYEEDIVENRLSTLKGNGRMLYTSADNNSMLDEFANKEYEIRSVDNKEYLYIDDTHIAGVGIHVQQNTKVPLAAGKKIRITKRIGFEKEPVQIGDINIAFFVTVQNYVVL